MHYIIEYILLITAAIIGGAPILLTKKYLQSNNFIWMIIALILAIILLYIYTLLLEKRNVSIVYTYLKLLSIIIVIFIGIIFFKESLDNEVIIAIVLGLISIYILSSKNISK